MIYNKFIICETVASFESSLAAGDIVNQHIVFIKETGKIWTDGGMYGVADVSDLPSAGTDTPGLVIVGDNITLVDGKISLTSSNIESALGYIPVAAKNSDGTINPTGVVKQLTLDGLDIYPVVTSDAIISSDGSSSLGDQISSINTELTELSNQLNTKVDEAPKNSTKAYIRKNGAWVELTANELSALGINVGETNVQADWNETDTSSDAYIKNKPAALTGISLTELTRLASRAGTNTATSLTDLMVDRNLVLATLAGPTTISVQSGMNAGESITVVCTPSADFIQPIPTSGSYVSMDGDSLNVKSGEKFEINILCLATGSYSISCKVSA